MVKSRNIDRMWVPLDHHRVLTLAADSIRQPCDSSDAYAANRLFQILLHNRLFTHDGFERECRFSTVTGPEPLNPAIYVLSSTAHRVGGVNAEI